MSVAPATVSVLMSADTPEQQRLSTDELLDARDLAWSRQLRAVSLVTEYSVDDRHADQALVVLARLYRRMLPVSARQAERVLRRWPAVQVVSMVNVAIGHYNHGNFWTSFFEQADLRQHQDAQRAWGSAFIDNLESLGLTTFSESDDAGTRYVGRVLMHSGMPTYWFFKLERAMILVPLLLPARCGCSGTVLGGVGCRRCGSRSRIA